MRFIVLLVGTLVIVGCQKDPADLKTPANPPPSGGPTNPKPGACADTKIDPSHRVISDSLAFNRTFEKVILIRCDGSRGSYEATSDSPKNTYIVNMETYRGTGERLYRKARNRTTCTGGTFKEEDLRDGKDANQPRMSLKMSTSPGTGRMHVKKDVVNIIDYEISRCLFQSDVDPTQCAVLEPIERGTLVLTPVYTETHVDNGRIDQQKCNP